MPALQTPLCNLDLKIGNSIIILEVSELKDVLEEAQVSIANYRLYSLHYAGQQFATSH
jgi:hypothetical protein